MTQPDTSISSRSKDVKAWCLFFHGDPQILCVSHSRAAVMKLAEKTYQSHWSLLQRDGYSIRMVWISERQKGQQDANS